MFIINKSVYFVVFNQTNIIINMLASFSDTEKTTLQGQSPKIAIKHGVSDQYVRYIINGKRKVKTSLAKKIYKDLQALIELLNPKSE